MFDDRHFAAGSFRENFDELIVRIGKKGEVVRDLPPARAKTRGKKLLPDSPAFLLNQGLFDRSVEPLVTAIRRGAF